MCSLPAVLAAALESGWRSNGATVCMEGWGRDEGGTTPPHHVHTPPHLQPSFLGEAWYPADPQERCCRQIHTPTLSTAPHSRTLIIHTCNLPRRAMESGRPSSKLLLAVSSVREAQSPRVRGRPVMCEGGKSDGSHHGNGKCQGRRNRERGIEVHWRACTCSAETPGHSTPHTPQPPPLLEP